MTFAALSVPRFQGQTRTLTLQAAVLVFGASACLVLQAVDPRLFNGINVWIKPAKFFASLAIHFATVAWALTLLPAAIQAKRSVR